MFVQITSKHCYQTWYADTSSWAGVLCKKIGLLPSRSRSQQGLIRSKYDSVFCIFWTAESFTAKLGGASSWVFQKDLFAVFKVKVATMAHMVKVWQYLLHLLNRWIFYHQTWWCIIMSLSKRLVCCLQGQGHSEGLFNQNLILKFIFWSFFN